MSINPKERNVCITLFTCEQTKILNEVAAPNFGMAMRLAKI